MRQRTRVSLGGNLNSALSLIGGQRSVSCSPVGSPATMAWMLDFATLHQIKPEIEKFKFTDINKAIDRLRSGETRYRVTLWRQIGLAEPFPLINYKIYYYSNHAGVSDPPGVRYPDRGQTNTALAHRGACIGNILIKRGKQPVLEPLSFDSDSELITMLSNVKPGLIFYNVLIILSIFQHKDNLNVFSNQHFAAQ